MALMYGMIIGGLVAGVMSQAHNATVIHCAAPVAFLIVGAVTLYGAL